MVPLKQTKYMNGPFKTNQINDIWAECDFYVVCNAPENSKTERGGLNFVNNICGMPA